MADDAYDPLGRSLRPGARDVLAMARERAELTADRDGDPPDLLAEAVYAARHEQALIVGDALLRRTRVGLLAARA